MTGSIVGQFGPDAHQWVAYFQSAPQAAFGGDLSVVAIRRLLIRTRSFATATCRATRMRHDAGNAGNHFARPAFRTRAAANPSGLGSVRFIPARKTPLPR